MKKTERSQSGRSIRLPLLLKLQDLIRTPRALMTLMRLIPLLSSRTSILPTDLWNIDQIVGSPSQAHVANKKAKV